MFPQLYFAYGSNLNKDDWNDPDKKRPDFDTLFKVVSTAVLKDHKLAFTAKSENRNGGVLDIIKANGSDVPGVVFKVISQAGWDALDEKEGVKAGTYQRVGKQVVAGGAGFGVVTYEVKNKIRYVMPDSRYVDVVRKGLEAFGLPADSLDAAVRGV